MRETVSVAVTEHGAPQEREDRLDTRWGLRTGVFKVTAADGSVTLAAPPRFEPLGRLTGPEHAVLTALAERPHTDAELRALDPKPPAADPARDHTAGNQPPDPAPEPHTAPSPTDTAPPVRPPAGPPRHTSGAFLDRLRAGGWLSATVTLAGRLLYTIDPVAPAPTTPCPPASPASPSRLRLSRFAVLRRDERGLLLESPLSWCELRVHDATLLAEITVLDDRPAPDTGTGPDLSTSGPLRPASGQLDRAVRDRLRDDLRRAGLAVPFDDTEDTDLRLRQWNPHDLAFHQHSRLGRRGTLGVDFGGTWWARERHPAPPARRTAYPGEPIPLHRPDIAVLRAKDPSLTAVLEDRFSVRRHDDEAPLGADELGEFLYRSASTRSVQEADGFEYAVRPHPSGGSAYELELYPVIRSVQGLDAGMYHYDSHDHRLLPVTGPRATAVRRLLRTAATSAGSPEPQVLLIVAARFGRLMWKYERMAYALVLKHVGVLFQTMYLTATAMGLAPCALGSGDSSAFTEATGADPYEECAVGEFMLGSRPEGVARWEAAR